MPPTAATVRCPKCKTLLEVSGPEAAPPPPPAKPLPFAPAPGKPAPAKAKAKAAPPPNPAAPRPIRPEVVDEELEAEEERARKAREEAERKRQVRKELGEMDRAEEQEQEQYEEVKERCRHGRMALQTLRWSLAGYVFSLVIGYLVVMGLVALAWIFGEKDIFGALGTTLPAFSLFVTVCSLLGTGVGFGMALRGPREALHLCIMGLVAAVAQLICLGVTLPTVFNAATNYAENPPAQMGYPGMTVAYELLGTATNLQTLTDSSVRLIYGVIAKEEYRNHWLGALCGLFEFVRLLLVCQITQRYAELGKSDRVAAESPTTVSRVFFTLLVFGAFRLATCVGFDWFQHPDGGWYIGQIIHLANFEICFLIIAVRLLTQFRAMDETAEVLIADRVGSRFERFNEV
ncbi:MAG: hypothetical protein MUF18_20235 [Fimbriiglobus sp.]|nr:hypothetical protein [Fimbriiglobus sp.]